MNRVEELTQSRIFHGVFRVMSCNVLHTRSGKKYMRLQLDDCSGSITAFAWHGQYQGAWIFESMAVINAKGRTRCHQGKWVADLREVFVMEHWNVPASSLLPLSKCSSKEQLHQLVDVDGQIEHTLLRRFVNDVLSDMAIAIPFLIAPGSLKHHHNEEGGLLRHSVESALIASSIPMLNDDHRDMAIIGALFHDLGKIKVFENMRRTNIGHLVDHQALTLEVCAPQLRALEDTWPDAALALRHVLTCRSMKRWGYEPRMAIAHVVQLADKISVELDMEGRSFSGTSDSRNVSNRMTKDSTSYWRPSQSVICENSQQM